MVTPAESTTEWIRTSQREMTSHLNALALRISTWLIVGNAAALVLIFKAVLEPRSCATSLVQPAVWYFLAGLGLAFVGTVGNYLASLAALNLMGKVHALTNQIAVNEYYIAKLQEEGVDVPEDAPLQVQMRESGEKLPSLQKQLMRLWVAFWIVVALFLLSAVMFGEGVTSPLRKNLVSTCSHIPVETTKLGLPQDRNFSVR